MKNNKKTMLPRTWGREFSLLFDGEYHSQIWYRAKENISHPALILLITLEIGGVIVCCVTLLGAKLVISLVCLMITILICLSYVSLKYLLAARPILRPIYFSRLADEKRKAQDVKVKEFNAKLKRDPHYRVASQPEAGVERVRLLVERESLPTRELELAAKAILEDDDALEVLDGYKT